MSINRDDFKNIQHNLTIARQLLNDASDALDELLSDPVEPDPDPNPDPVDPPKPPNASKYQNRIGMNINQGGSDAQVWADLLANEMWVAFDWSGRKGFPKDNTSEPCLANIHVDGKAGESLKLNVGDGGVIECFGTRFSESSTIVLSRDTPSEVFKVHVPGSFELYRQGDELNVIERRYRSLIRPFDIIRGLDPLRINNSPQRTVNDHVRYTHPCQSSPSYGCAIEEFLDVCTEVNSHAWVLIPHLAEADLIKHIATACHTFRSETGLDVYLEYSNEMWNSQFHQAKWGQSQGLANYVRRDGEDEHVYKNRAKATFYGHKCADVFLVFDSVMTDYIRVLSWLAHANWTQQVVLDSFQERYRGTPDRFAIAPYLHLNVSRWIDAAVEEVFKMPAKDKYAQWRGLDGEDWVEAEEDLVDEHLASMWKPYDVVDRMFFEDQGLARSKKAMDVYKAFSERNNIPICSYENGQHIIPPVNRYHRFNKILEECQNDPRWPEIYKHHRENWKSLGFWEDVYLSCVQSPRRGTAFGHREHVDQNHVKWDALDAILNDRITEESKQ